MNKPSRSTKKKSKSESALSEIGANKEVMASAAKVNRTPKGMAMQIFEDLVEGSGNDRVEEVMA